MIFHYVARCSERVNYIHMYFLLFDVIASQLKRMKWDDAALYLETPRDTSIISAVIYQLLEEICPFLMYAAKCLPIYVMSGDVC